MTTPNQNLCCSLNGIMVCMFCGRRYCEDCLRELHKRTDYTPKPEDFNHIVCLCNIRGAKRWMDLNSRLLTPSGIYRPVLKKRKR